MFMEISFINYWPDFPYNPVVHPARARHAF
jgi:hypothetical protein